MNDTINKRCAVTENKTSDDHHENNGSNKRRRSQPDEVNDDNDVMGNETRTIEDKKEDNDDIPIYHKINKKIKRKHINPMILQLRNAIQICCKQNDLYTAIQYYNAMAITQQVPIEAQTFYNLLHLCSSSSSSSSSSSNSYSNDGTVPQRPIHVGTPKTTKSNTNQVTTVNTTKTTTTTNTVASNGNMTELPKKSDINDDDNNEDTTIKPSASTIDNNNNNSNSTVIVVDDTVRRAFAERVKRHIDLLHIPLNENAYTAIVRVLLLCPMKSTNDDITAAMKILNEAEQTLVFANNNNNTATIKLRLYTPILQYYCQHGFLVDAIRIWERLSSINTKTRNHDDNTNCTILKLSEMEYCALIQCCCKVKASSKRIAAMVMEHVLSDLSEDIVIPCSETRNAIIRWFQCQNSSVNGSGNDNVDNDTISMVQNLLNQIQYPNEQQQSSCTGIMGPVQSTNGWSISDQCCIDTKSGKLLSGCLLNEQLVPISISPDTYQSMKQMNESIAITNKAYEHDTTSVQGGGKGRKEQLNHHTIQQRKKHWEAFQTFLDMSFTSTTTTMDDTIETIIIDGANVGYYEQNFKDAPNHVDYDQIHWIIQHFLHQQEQEKKHIRILLIMHSRHFASNLMPESAQPVVQEWMKLNILYQTPIGMNDDWFWLHAALYFGGGDSKTYIITNDEMRDHYFQMIAPRSFIRWRERHQIHFAFGNWISHDTGVQQQRPINTNNNGNNIRQKVKWRREVILHYPNTYSRRIQRINLNHGNGCGGFVIPLPKIGDTNRFLDGIFEVIGSTTPTDASTTATTENDINKTNYNNSNTDTGTLQPPPPTDQEMYVCIRPNK